MTSFSHHTRLLLVMTAQVVLSVTFIGGYFFLLYKFMGGSVFVPADYKDMFVTLLGVLTAGVGMILSFWFQRVRGSTDNANPPGTP